MVAFSLKLLSEFLKITSLSKDETVTTRCVTDTFKDDIPFDWRINEAVIICFQVHSLGTLTKIFVSKLYIILRSIFFKTIKKYCFLSSDFLNAITISYQNPRLWKLKQIKNKYLPYYIRIYSKIQQVINCNNIINKVRS